MKDSLELREQIYLTLRSNILEGRLKVGERIIQEELANRINVSRMPVREALKRLTEDGLVITIPNKGTWVREFKREQLIEIYMIRRHIEKMAVEISVANFLPDDISKLIAINRNFERALIKGSLPEMIKYNEEFHFALYELSHFPYLVNLIRDLWDKFPRYTFNIIPGQGDRSVKEHWDIIDSVSRGNVELSGSLMWNHIEGGQHNLIKQLKSEKPAEEL